jgi:D-alanyl-D-alanine carboxypeptidase
MDDLLDGVPAKLGPETKYGLGVIIRPTAYGVSYGHSGFMPGYQTDVMYFPKLKTAIAVQVNSSASRSTGRPLSRFLTEFAGIISGRRPK